MYHFDWALFLEIFVAGYRVPKPTRPAWLDSDGLPSALSDPVMGVASWAVCSSWKMSKLTPLRAVADAYIWVLPRHTFCSCR